MFKVSIIVPAYNVEKYIEECISSLINQTYSNIEVIIIDDKSIDNTSEIMKKFEIIDSRIKCIYNKKNMGANLSRTIGIENATGDYLMFVDSDDYILSETIEDLINQINTYDADIVKFNYINSNIDLGISNKKIYNKSNKEELYKTVLTTMKYNNLSNEIIRKKLFKIENDVFSIRSSVGEDLQINLELFDTAEKIVLIPDRYYYYRENNNSTTKTENLDRIYKNIEEIKYIYDSLRIFAKKWNLLTKEIESSIVLRETKGILDNIIRILNSNVFTNQDYNKINSILKNNEIIRKVNKYDIKQINCNIINKKIYLCIYKKRLKEARILLKLKKMIKSLMGEK